ncbi:MAG: hypothetical protein PHW74_04870 [Desulfobacca sp.]|nr:hypothetical protein [Desulfobacca sp.]
MAKAKQKRVLKEINKLWRTGKYWEWLRLVEQEGLVKAQASQWQEAWHNLSRRALRLPNHLEEFWQRLPKLKNIPDNPDIVFIRLLQDFLDNEAVRPDISSLTDLSPAAQLMREKILGWSWDSGQDKKIDRIIKVLVNQPEKVTGRTFTELNTLLKNHPLSEALRSLSKDINQIRKFNSKAAVTRNWVGLTDRELKMLDNRLDRLASSLDAVLREVLLYPFIYQAVQLFERLVDREDFDELAHLAAVIPFIFSQAAGPRAEDLKNRCRQLAGEIVTEAEVDDYLKQVLPQDLEAKIAALGKVRLALRALDPSRKLVRRFYNLYERVMDEIGARQTELSPREKFDLMQVMDPIIFRDLDWLMDDPEEVRFFLNRALNSGCGGVMISTLALFTAERTGNRPLKQKAWGNLQNLPYPGDNELIRILDSFEQLIFPSVRLVKDLLDLYPTEVKLRNLLFDRLLTELKMFLVTNAMGIKFEKSAAINQTLKKVLQQTLQKFKQDLAELEDYEEVMVLKDLAECFSEGYLTAQGYRALFQKVCSRLPSFDDLIFQIDRYFLEIRGMGHDLDDLFLNMAAGDWLDEQEELLFQFIIEHHDDLRNASPESIELIVDRFCHPEFMHPNGLNFFLQLSSRLEERVKNGEAAATEIQNRIINLLLEYRQTRPTRRKSTR